MIYFAYEPDSGVYFFNTADKAATWAQGAINACREEAALNGSWCDNVERVVWGEVKQKSYMRIADAPIDDATDKIYADYNLENVE